MGHGPPPPRVAPATGAGPRVISTDSPAPHTPGEVGWRLPGCPLDEAASASPAAAPTMAWAGQAHAAGLDVGLVPRTVAGRLPPTGGTAQGGYLGQHESLMASRNSEPHAFASQLRLPGLSASVGACPVVPIGAWPPGGQLHGRPGGVWGAAPRPLLTVAALVGPGRGARHREGRLCPRPDAPFLPTGWQPPSTLPRTRRGHLNRTASLPGSGGGQRPGAPLGPWLQPLDGTSVREEGSGVGASPPVPGTWCPSSGTCHVVTHLSPARQETETLSDTYLE